MDKEVVDTIVVLAGFVFSLALARLPKLSQWYATLDPTMKRVAVFVSLIGAGVGVLGFSCLSLIPLLAEVGFTPIVTCSTSGAIELLRALLLAGGGSQLGFLLVTRKQSLYPPNSRK